jgi:hypothetical protein
MELAVVEEVDVVAAPPLALPVGWYLLARPLGAVMELVVIEGVGVVVAPPLAIPAGWGRFARPVGAAPWVVLVVVAALGLVFLAALLPEEAGSSALVA